VLGQREPLVTAVSPVLHNLNPLLSYIDLYQPEVQAAFSNAAAASQATATSSNELPGSVSALHYLRALSGPLNPASQALQSPTFGSTRTNPYPAPGAYNQLASGLSVLESSSCSNPTPGVTGPPNANVSADTLTLITKLGIVGSGSNGNVAAPACKQQAPQTFAGLTSTFPHVLASSN
jgi:hypothetical protein